MLFKYSGKYVKIYFNMKITFSLKTLIHLFDSYMVNYKMNLKILYTS